MRIGIPKESLPGETRVAATPRTVVQLLKLGHEVVVESGAGKAASLKTALIPPPVPRWRMRPRCGLARRCIR